MTPIKPDPHPHDTVHPTHRPAGHDLHDNEDVAHEPSDVNIRAVIMFCVGLAVVVAVAHVAMWGLFTLLERQAVQNDPVLSPLAIPAGQAPPEPRLLINEPANLREIKAGEQQVLEGYGWVDQKVGTARIPIEEAKKKLLHDGLPVRAEGPAADSLGTSWPTRGESSGGRILTAKPQDSATAKPSEVPATEHKAPAPQKSGGH